MAKPTEAEDRSLGLHWVSLMGGKGPSLAHFSASPMIKHLALFSSHPPLRATSFSSAASPPARQAAQWQQQHPRPSCLPIAVVFSPARSLPAHLRFFQETLTDHHMVLYAKHRGSGGGGLGPWTTRAGALRLELLPGTQRPRHTCETRRAPETVDAGLTHSISSLPCLYFLLGVDKSRNPP